jgi:hypothetical protein
MSLENLIRETRKRMGPTRAARLADAQERSRVFNERCATDLENQKVTPELLAKRCTL